MQRTPLLPFMTLIWLATLSAHLACGQGGAPPPGTIHFNFHGQTWTMNGNGGAKTALPAGVAGQPSRQLHGGQRWFLQFVGVSGTYPDGGPRVDLFAIRGDGLAIVQLTDQADLEPVTDPWSVGSPRWSPTDAKISFSAGRWVGGTMTDGGIHVLDILFDGAGNVTGLAQLPGTPLVPCAIFTDSNGSRPEILSHDWSPAGVNLVFARDAGTPASRQLFIANITLPGGGPQLLPTSRPAGSPSWSPTGTKIVFTGAEFAGSIYTINPNGTGEDRILRPHAGAYNYLARPAWSANGQHVIYEEGGTVGDRCDVYRANASGSQKVNLTSDLDTHNGGSGFPARPVGWR